MSKPGKVTIHPFAEFFPLIEGKAFDSFVQDVRENGQREPILIIKGKGGAIQIVDGRNRQRACEAIGVKPIYKTWDGKGSLLKLVMSLNLRRRHLTATQRAASVIPYKKEIAKLARARVHAGQKQNRSVKIHGADTEKGDARDQAAELAEVSNTYVDIAEKAFDEDRAIYGEMILGSINAAQARIRLGKHDRRNTLETLCGKPLPKECRIVVGDCIEQLRRMPAACARVIFADPPYNNRTKYNNDPTGDDLNDSEYLDWCQEWMVLCADRLTPDGSMFVMIDDNYSDHFGVILRRLGLVRRNTIIWWEHFPAHQVGNFSKKARLIHYYTKSKKFVWHPKWEPSGRNHHKDPRGNPEGKVPDNVWEINRAIGSTEKFIPFVDAPPMLPDEVPLRCILAASEPGDLVIDPFSGNAVTGRAALISGRRYTGIERSEKYAEQSKAWMRAVLQQEKLK